MDREGVRATPRQRRWPALVRLAGPLPPLLVLALALHGCRDGKKGGVEDTPGTTPTTTTTVTTNRTQIAADMPSEAAGQWGCHHYEDGQNNEWCANVGVHAGYEYKFFGRNGPCGECWCCKRQVPWTCHYYQDGQDDDWCRSAGVRSGREYKFFGANSPCGVCGCCKRDYEAGTTTTTTGIPPSERLGSFMVIGDWGWDPGHHGEITSAGCQQAIANAMAAAARRLGDLKFVVNVGDSFYPAGVTGKSDWQWQAKWRNIYPKEVRAVPWYSVYGNHDYIKDPCVCNEDVNSCGQVNRNVSDLDYFYMPDTSWFRAHPELKLEVIALDMNFYTWADNTCKYTDCPAACNKNLKARNDAAFKLWRERIASSKAESLVVFSHYPSDYFWGFPDFLRELRDNSKHRIEYFAGHRHNVDQSSVTSIAPNNHWLVGGGGGWGCEFYSKEQGFVVGEIGPGGRIATYPVLVDFDACCPRSA